MVCRTALPDRPRGPRGGAPSHLPDRQEFAGPLAGPGVVRWSVKPNRSPARKEWPKRGSHDGTQVVEKRGVLAQPDTTLFFTSPATPQG